MNADFANGMTQLFPDKVRKKWSNKKLDKKKYSCSTFMIYLGIDKVYEDLPHHQIYASANYEKNLEDIEKNHKLTWDDPSIYVQNACVVDPSLAPEGCSTVYALVPVSHIHENIDWDAQKDAYRNRIIEQIEEKLGFEGLRDHIVTEMVITPEDWGDHCYRGAVSTWLTALTRCSGAARKISSTRSTTCTSSAVEPTPAAVCRSSTSRLASAASSPRQFGHHPRLERRRHVV